MVIQNGQLAATMVAFDSKISLVRSKFIRDLPGSSSLNICPPPAPQHKPFDLQRLSSIKSASSAASTERGAS